MINDIHLQCFRSYKDESFEFSNGVNIIVGPNASGKTNLLESILLSCMGSSYRASDGELINFKKKWTRVEANYGSLNRVIKISRTGNEQTAKTYEINTKKIKRLNLSQTIPVVLFEPNNLLILIGSPELRRNFIDEILDQIIPGYKSLRNQYKRALSQRNALLKRPKQTNPELFVWNLRLSELGGKIINQRLSLVEKILGDVTGLYNAISGGKEKIGLSYKSAVNASNYSSNLLKMLEQNETEDLARGFTIYGPHRDDLEFYINAKPASEVASRGETRSLLLALKIIETKIIESARDQKPLLLFDDVFSELDGARRLALIKNLDDYQTFITTTDADVVLHYFTKSANIIPITNS